MNKVVTINLQGVAFQLEEAGYDALRAYLDGAARRLEGNPDRDEIIADIEQAIADRCRAVLGAYKTVVGASEVAQIIDEMGPVEDASADTDERTQTAAAGQARAAAPGAAASESRPPPPPPPPVRRLYKVPDGAMIAGVCNGLAAYLGVDVTIVRILFVLLTFLSVGIGILVYIVLMIIVPTADTTTEKAAAYGAPSTAQEFIRRAREGYYEGIRTLGDKRAHREWRRRFRREMRTWGHALKNEAQAHAERWRQQWYASMAAKSGAVAGTPRWQPPGGVPGMAAPVFPAGMWIAMPFLALIRAAIAVVAILAIASLVTTGAVFGLALPHDLPVWAGVIGVLVLWALVAAPFKAVRHMWHYQAAYGPRLVPPIFWFGDTVIAVGGVILMFWLVYHYVPQAHEALHNLPAALQSAAESVKAWWNAH